MQLTLSDAVQRTVEHREIFHDEMLALMRRIMSGEVSPVMIAALTVGLRVKKETMVGLLRGDPAFAELFLAYVLSRNVRIEEDLVDQLFNSSEKRLARLLLLLAHFGKESKPEPVLPKVSQETLAAMIGTTRSRVSFFMNRFRKMGFIEYNGGLHVHSALLTVVLRD